MSDLTSIDYLLDNVATLNKSYEILAKSSGEHFNIFSILRMETDENSTHSALIAELLRKDGSHKFGSKFLELFIEYFRIENVDFNFEKYQVYTEYFIGAISKNYETGGRIDILIKDDKQNIIMIENKIYASEQIKQLIRYRNEFPSGNLFFLTLNGRETECKKSAEIHNLYKPISYETDIINWLDLCRKEAIESPMLREVISQYIYLLRKLTNQNTNKEMTNEIISRVLSSETNFRSFRSLVGIQNQLIKKILKEDFLDVVEEIAYKNKMHFEEDHGFLEGQRYKGFRLMREDFEKLNMCIRFDFEGRDFKDPLLGLEYLNKNIDIAIDYSGIIQNFNDILPNGILTSENFVIYNWFYKSEDWRSLTKLQEIKFGEFKINLKNKLERLINILENK